MYLGFTLVLYAGAASALVAPRLAAFLLLGGVICLFATHLLMGVLTYRRTMSRPWPRVRPLEDEDDEW